MKPPMSITEVYQALCHLKQSGTRGLDGIDGKILKLSAPVIAETLTYVYNLCIDKSHFPSQLKQARIIPIFKSGDPSQPSNYRPISILPVLSKPLEKHINKHLSKHLETYDLLHINQSGLGKAIHAKLLTSILLINGYTISMRTNSQGHYLLILQRPLML